MQISLLANSFSWGEVVKIDLSKEEVHSIIKKYVDHKYPDKVSQYENNLKKEKADKLNKISNIVFVNNNLMWQDAIVNTQKKLNQLELKFYCKDLDLAQRKDWRVPTYSEMLTLVDYEKTDPSANAKLKYVTSSKYWTSSNDIQQKDSNWFVDFEYGKTGISSDLERYHIRCVRDISQKEGTY